jgi:hypothetical protein
MLTILRKIRKSLIESGSAQKYLLYAIGEIILVVIGILIALEINTRNTQSLERIQEQQILVQLKEEYLDNQEQLLSKMSVRDGTNRACGKLITLIDNWKIDSNPDSVDYLVSLTLLRPTLDPALGVTNELLTSGKLYLIRNDNLRKLLSDWTGKFFNELQEEEQIVANFIQDQYLPFLIENYQLRNSWIELIDLDMWKKVHFGSGSIAVEKIGQNEIGSHVNQLMSNKNFEDFLFSLYAYSIGANAQSEGVMAKIQEILDLIDLEMED